MKRIVALTSLYIVLLGILVACGVPQTSAPAAFATVTEPPKTLIPTRIANVPLTPFPETIFVTTRAGQTLQFQFIHMEPNEYVAFHTESMPDGIPLENGVEVAFKYITQVDFGLPSAGWDAGTPLAAWPVIVTLTDGTQLTRSLGFKAHHQIHVTGDSNYGYVDIHLSDVQRILIKRTGAPLPIPSEPPGDNGITVETANGETANVTFPKIFTICMYDVYCCHNDDIPSLPLSGMNDIPLENIRSADFSSPDSVIVNLKDGSSLTTKLRPSANCPTTAWRLRGKSALGDFEIELASIKKISR